MMIDDDNDGQIIFGDLGGLKLPDICLTGEEKPRKTLTQKTCPIRGLNPSPLRDRCTCYHLAHSTGLFIILQKLVENKFINTITQILLWYLQCRIQCSTCSLAINLLKCWKGCYEILYNRKIT